VQNEPDFKKINGFDWNEGNVDKNWMKHNVHYKEAEEIFVNSPRVLLVDKKHSSVEKRLIIYGVTNKNRKLTVAFTIRNYKFRIISARDMNKRERREYEKKIKNHT
jgi:hypothetical protein